MSELSTPIRRNLTSSKYIRDNDELSDSELSLELGTGVCRSGVGTTAPKVNSSLELVLLGRCIDTPSVSWTTYRLTHFRIRCRRNVSGCVHSFTHQSHSPVPYGRDEAAFHRPVLGQDAGDSTLYSVSAEDARVEFFVVEPSLQLYNVDNEARRRRVEGEGWTVDLLGGFKARLDHEFQADLSLAQVIWLTLFIWELSGIAYFSKRFEDEDV
ncbi:hypothetical protein J6590_101413 [Homalodisca vitripennis]|nr:hypothetical protein J6590_101413 [Homalodisca vitripennis]